MLLKIKFTENFFKISCDMFVVLVTRKRNDGLEMKKSRILDGKKSGSWNVLSCKETKTHYITISFLFCFELQWY